MKDKDIDKIITETLAIEAEDAKEAGSIGFISRALTLATLPHRPIKDEIEHLDVDLLPLEQGLSRSSHVSADRVGATILRVEAETGRIRVKAGLLYAGIIAGCGCADDPTPVDELAEYCEVWFEINAATGEAEVSLVTDEGG